MEEKDIRSALEAVLFTTGKAEKISDLAKALECDRDVVEQTIRDLSLQYETEGRGIRIIELEDAWQMCTDPAWYDVLIRLELQPKKPKLTEVQLETLSVIAYRQPVTKAEIERIRGVNSDHAVNKLVEYGLVRELGRAKLPGRPILFGTTEEFLRAFGVSSKDDLPDINPVLLEDFREEAENEATLNVDV
ncbi:MAG TPA: SMC-Scp complex subunit ScpB [Lachnospiraceae bacterium]|nr:SMC-Scp complex subunit ScpB [Lachnospiraceae bacterium]